MVKQLFSRFYVRIKTLKNCNTTFPIFHSNVHHDSNNVRYSKSTLLTLRVEETSTRYFSQRYIRINAYPVFYTRQETNETLAGPVSIQIGKVQLSVAKTMIDVDELATQKTMRSIEKQCSPRSRQSQSDRGRRLVRHPIGNRFVSIGLLNSWLTARRNRQSRRIIEANRTSLRAKTFQHWLKEALPSPLLRCSISILQLKSSFDGL